MSCDRRHRLEQQRTALVEMWCPLLWSLYSGWVREGFSTEQALELATEYMVATIQRPYDCPPAMPEEEDD